jgi:hypothetical protein
MRIVNPLLRDRLHQIDEDEYGRFVVCDMGDDCVLLIDEADFDEIGHLRWSVFKCHGGLRYIWRSGPILMHRQILDAPKGMTVDHEDGNGLNNRRFNIGLATYKENCARRVSAKNHGESGYRGVYRSGKRWYSTICVDYKLLCLGTFDTPEEAAIAWDASAIAARGRFTYLNFPQNAVVPS